jgi:glycosyltransferase involved in cell wall biosynthesis
MENAELVICGSISEDISEMVNEYKKKIQNVIFTGHINNPLEYYESCSVFVLTSVLEGMARVTLEAMSTGMPVIATPNTGCVVRDDVDGFIVAARDVEGLREKFLYFYNHQDQALVMGKNAFQRIRDYSWDAYSVRMAELFEKISGAH